MILWVPVAKKGHWMPTVTAFLGEVPGTALQDTRATAFHERFSACGEIALAPLPALEPSLGAR
jgi:hypothetical protein